MRILFDYRPALRAPTGVGEFVHRTAEALTETGPADERLVLFSSSWKDRLAPDVVEGASTVDSRCPGRLLHWLWHRLEWPSVERLTGQPFDLAQSAHPLLMPSTSAARVVTIYDLDFLDHPERTEREIRRDYAPLAARHAQRADQVIVISRHTAADVESRLEVPSHRITVCVPGAPSWARREREPDPGIILFVGSLDTRKNLGVLLDAYANLVTARPSAPRLVLAGRIPPSADALVARTRLAPLAGRVDLLGYVNDETKRRLYDDALAVVLPSHTEGFGLTAVEAMQAGAPVIAARRGALVDTVGDGGLLVDADEVSAWAEAMQALVDAPLRRRALADAGRKHAAQFTWQRTALAMREAWTHAIQHARGRRG